VPGNWRSKTLRSSYHCRLRFFERTPVSRPATICICSGQKRLVRLATAYDNTARPAEGLPNPTSCHDVVKRVRTLRAFNGVTTHHKVHGDLRTGGRVLQTTPVSLKMPPPLRSICLTPVSLSSPFSYHKSEISATMKGIWPAHRPEKGLISIAFWKETFEILPPQDH
jgi:hypothetical protein